MADKPKKTRGTSDGMLVSPERAASLPKPSLSVTEDDLPEIKNWEVGKKYNVKAKVEMRSHSKGDNYGYDEGGKKKHKATLIIHNISAEE